MRTRPMMCRCAPGVLGLLAAVVLAGCSCPPRSERTEPGSARLVRDEFGKFRRADRLDDYFSRMAERLAPERPRFDLVLDQPREATEDLRDIACAFGEEPD